MCRPSILNGQWLIYIFQIISDNFQNFEKNVFVLQGLNKTQNRNILELQIKRQPFRTCLLIKVGLSRFSRLPN